MKHEHLLVVILLCLLGIVGTLSYEDEKRDQAEYCRAVYSGDTPDYRGIYKTECPQYLGHTNEK